MRIAIDKANRAANGPTVVDLDSGAPLAKRIPERYRSAFEQAKAGSTLTFDLFYRNAAGHPIPPRTSHGTSA